MIKQQFKSCPDCAESKSFKMNVNCRRCHGVGVVPVTERVHIPYSKVFSHTYSDEGVCCSVYPPDDPKEIMLSMNHPVRSVTLTKADVEALADYFCLNGGGK